MDAQVTEQQTSGHDPDTPALRGVGSRGAGYRRCMRLLTIAFCAALPVSAVGALPAQAATCTKVVANDLNNDGKADVVLGQPAARIDGVSRAGAVDVRITGGSSFRLTGPGMGLGTATAGEFGSSVAIGYLNNDCYADLLLGAPRAAGGRVVYVPGAAGGIDISKGKIIESDNPAGTDRFGSAVAIGRGVAFVGAPYHDPNGVKNAGRVYAFTVAADDAVTAKGFLQQGTAPVQDSPEAGDHFGAVLAYRGDTLASGAPQENIVTATDAGAAHLTTFTQDDPAKPETDLFLNQDAAGVPGKAEKGDNFGAAFDDQVRAIGVPGEDVKSAADAGGIVTQVQTMTTNSPALRWVSQSSKGIPGKSKTGDRFGSALASGTAFLCPSKVGIAVGIPGKTVDAKVGAGMVTVVAETSGDCGTTQGRQITQDTSSIAGKVGKGNAFGTAFAVIPAATAAADGLLGGAPGSNLDDKRDTGRVANVLNLPKTSLRSLGGPDTDTFYGSVTTQR